jgi:hypothetical protein
MSLQEPNEIFTGRHQFVLNHRASPMPALETVLASQGGNPVYSYGDTWAAGAPVVLPSESPVGRQAMYKAARNQNSYMYMIAAGLAIWVIFFNK